MARTWDYTPTAPASRPPPTSTRRTASGLAGDALDSQHQASTPFPRSGSPEDDVHDKDVDLAQGQDGARTRKRTVRRKKSSFDLRDIFLNGGVYQSEPSPAQHSPAA